MELFFLALFVLSLCPFDISVDARAFVIGLSQISSFFSWLGILFFFWQVKSSWSTTPALAPKILVSTCWTVMIAMQFSYLYSIPDPTASICITMEVTSSPWMDDTTLMTANCFWIHPHWGTDPTGFQIWQGTRTVQTILIEKQEFLPFCWKGQENMT